eukprot:TRINITY_DN26716_c0_g1_i1.p1 TRINITY_DN26716_c0_g1~~TRINITY_DN26716_c0_g1_i1.p1  ORF type:complete len:157 (-),score=26.49 TRINITY_DN26716_c0_g1_i1:165-635(-)
MAEQFNPAPVVHARKARAARAAREYQEDDSVIWDSQEVFELVRDIQDPEHPYSLEQLNVISEDAISVDDKNGRLSIRFTPTVQHCGMAPLIGLSLRVKLLRSLPRRFKVDINLAPGSHSTEAAVNKQLNDKERVAAALENPHLAETIERCISASYE